VKDIWIAGREDRGCPCFNVCDNFRPDGIDDEIVTTHRVADTVCNKR